jgi:hypothetical protein
LTPPGCPPTHAGKQLLCCWDELCQALRARCVAVEDASNKSGMLLRVLQPAAFGTTWYGKVGCVAVGDTPERAPS